MHRQRTVTALALVLGAILAGPPRAAEPFRAGLQPGEKIAHAFHPLNVTGAFAGEEHCLVCEHGLDPVVMVFAREPSDALAALLVKLDAAVAAHKDASLGSFVVFLSDDKELPRKLPEFARKHKLQHIVLSIDPPAGPEGFKVTREADVIVVLYTEHVVKVNHAFKKGALDNKAVEQIAADLPKILPRK